MASKAALVVLALAFGNATAGDPINTAKYTAVGEAGACRGNGGAANNDKVNNKFKTGLTQAECETECDDLEDCLGYTYQTGNTAVGECLIHSPTAAGSCSDTTLNTREKCDAKGTCSVAGAECPESGMFCVGVEQACVNLGGIWTKSATTVWTDPVGGWGSDSHPTFHIDGANGNAEFTCYDIDLDDHDATCVNGEDHAGYTVHGKYLECAATWGDGSSCVDIEGCPATACDGDTLGSWCCETADCAGAWHYCGCERDFEAGGKVESACDTAAGCVYAAAPSMEVEATPHPGDVLHCDNVYKEGELGACKGVNSAGGLVSVNQKWTGVTKACDAQGVKKVCGGAGEPACEMTQAECEANCALENAIAPGRCQAYHHKPGVTGYCTMMGPTMHEGIGWEANPTCVEPASAGPGTCESAFTAASGTAEADCNTAGGCVYSKGAAAADSCWGYWSNGITEVTGTNTNIEYMCFMLKDTTVNNVCGSPSSDGAAAQTLAFGAALAAGLLA